MDNFTTGEWINTLWVLMAAFLVFFMNAGFAMLESGLCRSKNTVNILAKNFIIFGIGMIAFWGVGYGIAFGAGNSFMGTEGWFLGGLGDIYGDTEGSRLPLLAFFLFQLCFAVTAATIVSGAVAERIKIQSFMLLGLALTAIIYPIVVHWTWGGGWLSQMGFQDFAGSTVVHSVGGWAALTGAFLLGPRLGKYAKDGSVRPIPGHNIALVTLGGLILWLGWFGFNGGSELAVDGMMAHVVTATALSAACGTVAATIYAWLRVGKPDLTLIVNGMLGGLVGITAGCAAVELWGAALIGMASGILVIEAVMFFDKIKIDDPVGATSVHLVCGAFGTLMVGVVGHGTWDAEAGAYDWAGLAFGGGLSQLWVQFQGVVAVGAFVGASSFAVWYVIKVTVGIRVSEDDEMAGLDISEMGMEAYPSVPDRDSTPAASPAEALAPTGAPALSRSTT